MDIWCRRTPAASQLEGGREGERKKGGEGEKGEREGGRERGRREGREKRGGGRGNAMRRSSYDSLALSVCIIVQTHARTKTTVN